MNWTNLATPVTTAIPNKNKHSRTAVNKLFVNAYIDSYQISKYGKVIEAKAIFSHEPKLHRGYKYRIDSAGEIRDVVIKSKLNLGKTKKFIVSHKNEGRVFLLKGSGGFISVFNGLTGGWFISVLFILMHLGIIKLTYLTSVKILIQNVLSKKYEKTKQE